MQIWRIDATILFSSGGARLVFCCCYSMRQHRFHLPVPFACVYPGYSRICVQTLVQHIEERHRGKKLQAGCLMTTLRRKSWTTYSSSSDRTYNRGTCLSRDLQLITCCLYIRSRSNTQYWYALPNALTEVSCSILLHACQTLEDTAVVGIIVLAAE